MSKFIQIHTLTSYAPANLNREETGRPKTAKFGGFERLRVSSQSSKRNWRVSDVFQTSLADHIGTRTKKLGVEVFNYLIEKEVKEKDAKAWAIEIAGVFGKGKKDSLEIEQLAHISPSEKTAVFALADQLAAENRGPQKDELQLLKAENQAADIALFGRMLASSPEFNVEAACQVAHAISVENVTVESDYFTAVDDLNAGKGDQGAAHIGDSGFASAVLYNYICIDKEQLVDNLSGDLELANKTIASLLECIAKISPKGKQNSFASHAYASYILVEKGGQQPRSLASAFVSPVKALDERENVTQIAVQRLESQIKNFDSVYEPCADSRQFINVLTGEGNFKSLQAFAAD